VAYRLRRGVLRLFVLTSALALLVAAAPGVSASPSSGISFTKTCSDWCTVANSSNPSLVPDGSTLTYFGPRFDPHLSSGFVLDTGAGSAVGRCQLNWATGIGSCSIDRGVGSLAGIHVVLSEWVDFAGPNLEDFVFHLDGTYHVE
jgi:hypothetical protein